MEKAIRRVEFRSKLNCLLLVETLLIVGDWCIKPLIYRLVCHNASGSVCHSQCIRGGSECFQQLLFFVPYLWQNFTAAGGGSLQAQVHHPCPMSHSVAYGISLGSIGLPPHLLTVSRTTGSAILKLQCNATKIVFLDQNVSSHRPWYSRKLL